MLPTIICAGSRTTQSSASRSSPRKFVHITTRGVHIIVRIKKNIRAVVRKQCSTARQLLRCQHYGLDRKLKIRYRRGSFRSFRFTARSESVRRVCARVFVSPQQHQQAKRPFSTVFYRFQLARNGWGVLCSAVPTWHLARSPHLLHAGDSKMRGKKCDGRSAALSLSSFERLH